MVKEINENGILFIAKTILGLAETVGIIKARKIIENQPNLLIELLGEEDVLNTQHHSEQINPWNKRNTKKYLQRLKLTKYQTLILKTILEQDNKATLTDLEKAFEDKGFTVKNGSMIGGSLAGITKKCESYLIPPIYESQHLQDGEISYSVVKGAKSILPELLH
jgi:hypothetical protein